MVLILLIEEFFAPFLKKNGIIFFLYICFTLFTYPFQALILPHFYSTLFSNIEHKKSPIFSFEIFKNILGNTTPHVILKIIAVWLILQFTNMAKGWTESIFIPDFFTFVRTKIFEKTIDSLSNDYEEIPSGEYITRLLELSRYIKNILSWTFSEIIPNIIALIVTIIFFMKYDKLLSGIMAFNIVLLMSLFYIFGEELIEVIKQREIDYFGLSESMNDSMNNLMNIYLNNKEDGESEKNKAKNVKVGVEYSKHKIGEAVLVFTSNFFTNITYALSIILLYHKFCKKKLSTTEMIAAVLLLNNYMNYTNTLTNDVLDFGFSNYGMIKASEPFLEKIFSKNNKRTQQQGITKGKVQFKNISYNYKKQENKLFEDFNLTIQGGEKVAIIGPSGSGKTSLMKLLISMYKPSKGQILIDDNDISKMKQKYIRDNVIYINQRTTLFNENIIDNIAYGNDNVDKKHIETLLTNYQLNTVFSELKNGIYSPAGVNGTNLSGGMQKVTILLRGVLKEGKIYIFDEPLAGLDGTTREKVIKMILDMTKGKTLIIITHDPEITPFMDKVVNLKNQKEIK
jgi:ABC-type bacteriocin/lantibiotic exporter with double-glycine peptidase domain